MGSEIQQIELRIKEVQNLHKSGDYKKSLGLCNSFIRDYPKAWVGYRTKADILLDVKDYQEALITWEKLAEIGSDEPSDYYDLSRLCLSLGKNRECVDWAEKAIALCKQHKKFYYFQACHFYMTNALINLGLFSAALRCCNILDDGYSAHIRGVGVKNKEELLASIPGKYRAKK